MSNINKAKQLADIEGFDSPMQAAEEYGYDTVCPGICVNKSCDYTTETEHDCRNGCCENCGTKTVKSIMILLGIG